MRRILTFLVLSLCDGNAFAANPTTTVSQSAATTRAPSGANSSSIEGKRASSGAIGTRGPTSADSFRKKLDQIGWTYRVGDAGQYIIIFDMNGTKRTQMVVINKESLPLDSAAVREIYSYAATVSGTINGAQALELLADSHDKKIGSWEIHGNRLAYTIKVLDTLGIADIIILAKTIAGVADAKEQKLTGDKDEF